MALKIGLVGMGGIGNTHAGVYKNDELANLVAVCDVKKEIADGAAEKSGVLFLEGDARGDAGAGYRGRDDVRL